MNKKTAFRILFVIASLILASGVFFSIYAFENGVVFKMLGNDVPGVIFGVVAIFLGVRYIRSLKELKKRIEGSNAKFSWSNFRKTRSVKS